MYIKGRGFFWLKYLLPMADESEHGIRCLGTIRCFREKQQQSFAGELNTDIKVLVWPFEKELLKKLHSFFNSDLAIKLSNSFSWKIL